MIQAVRRPNISLWNYQAAANRMLATPTQLRQNPAPSPMVYQQPIQAYHELGLALLSAFFPQLQQMIKPGNPFLHNVSSPVAEPEEKPATPLRVVLPHHKLMSYNVENFVKTSRGKSIKSVESIQALSEAILKESPDVIALQEVGDKKLLEEFNKKYLNNQYPNIVCPPAADPSTIRVAMMSKSNMRVLESKSHMKEMSEGANFRNRRDFLETTFKTDTGFKFTVYNAHCKSMRGGEEETAPIRMQEVRNAAKILKAHFKKDPKAPVFVTGDFNTLHDTPFGKPVIEILTHLGGSTKRKPALTEVMMKDDKPDPTHNGNEFYPNTKLDYIFASHSLVPQIRKAYVAGSFTQAPWKQASDHLPYVTEFEELPKASEKRSASRDGNRVSKRSHILAIDNESAQNSTKNNLVYNKHLPITGTPLERPEPFQTHSQDLVNGKVSTGFNLEHF